MNARKKKSNLELRRLLKRQASVILEALSEELRICSIDISPNLKKLAGLAVVWNLSISDSYAIDERIVIAEHIIKEIDAELWPSAR